MGRSAALGCQILLVPSRSTAWSHSLTQGGIQNSGGCYKQVVLKVFLPPSINQSQSLRGDLLFSQSLDDLLFSQFFWMIFQRSLVLQLMLLQNLLDPRVSDDLLQITEHLSGRAETRTQIYRSPSLLVYYPPRIHHQASRRLCLHIQPHSPLEQVKEQGLQKTGKIALTDPQEFQFFLSSSCCCCCCC